ncbi:MAG: serine/threonine-protein phosphatase [Planctomycetes bacterium]|nr:serine/threonine-protein phosphatase [Planctomycetota bacterium]
MWKNLRSQGGSDPGPLKATFPEGALLDCHGDSRIGRLRKINQDRFFTLSFMLKPSTEWHALPDDAVSTRVTDKTGYLFGVADGVGGAPAGEQASLLVVGTLKAFIKEEFSTLLRAGRPDSEIVETLRRGLRRCQAVLAEEVRHHPEYRGMGTTLTAAVVLWPRLFLFHLGDSRAYLFRGGSLRRLTQDHTYAQYLVNAGVLDSKKAERSRWKHVVWNTLGGKDPGRDSEVHPDVHIQDLRGDDVLLLCTDGLSDPLTDETIRRLLSKGGSSEDLCKGLLDSAREMKAQDDATLVVARFAEAAKLD